MINRSLRPFRRDHGNARAALPLMFALLLACSDDDTDANPKNTGATTLDTDVHATKDVGQNDAGSQADVGPTKGSLSCFVTSDTSKTGNLGGLAAADARC